MWGDGGELVEKSGWGRVGVGSERVEEIRVRLGHGGGRTKRIVQKGFGT